MCIRDSFKVDEAAQFITGPYRRLHPHDNNERQAIHEHGRVVEPSPVRYPATQRRASQEPQRLSGGGAP